MNKLLKPLATIIIAVSILCGFASASYAARGGKVLIKSGPYCSSMLECRQITRDYPGNDGGEALAEIWVATQVGLVLARRGRGESIDELVDRLNGFPSEKHVAAPQARRGTVRRGAAPKASTKAPAATPVAAVAPTSLEPAVVAPHPDPTAQQERDALIARVTALEKWRAADAADRAEIWKQHEAEIKALRGLMKDLTLANTRLTEKVENLGGVNTSSRESLHNSSQQTTTNSKWEANMLAASIGLIIFGIVVATLYEVSYHSAPSDGPSGGTAADAPKPRFAAVRAFLRSVFRRSASQEQIAIKSEDIPVAYTVDRDPDDPLIGSTVTVRLSDACIKHREDHPPEFGATITARAKDPPTGSNRVQRGVIAIYTGYPEWEMFVPPQDRGDPVELAILFDTGTVQYRTGPFIKMIALAVSGDASERSKLVRHWLATKALEIDPSVRLTAPPIVPQRVVARAA